jgi:RNA polymerase sigma-70 factor (ECF subfamily)
VDEPAASLAATSDDVAKHAPAAEPAQPAEPTDDVIRDRDLELVGRVCGGETEAFNRIVDFYQDYLFGLAFRILSDRDQAADAVQDALLHAFRHLGTFRGGSFRSWLTRIGVNACMDVLRVKRRRPSQPFPDLEDDSWEPSAPADQAPEERAERAARARVLREALGRIAHDQRVAIVLYDVEGYDYAEIAVMTGVSLGTVKSRIHRGRLALRALLTGQMELFR